MEISDTKLALDEIKLNLERFSNSISRIIPLHAFCAAVLMVLFTLLSQNILRDEIVDHIIFLTPDIYTLVSLLGLLLTRASVVSGLLAAFTIIFSIAFIAITVIILYKFYEISRNFWSLSRVDVVLKQSNRIYTYLFLYISFIAISYIIPSFGWIIAIVFANISLFIAFIYFHKILKKYGLRLQIVKDTSFLIGIGAFFNLLAAGLVFVDISFLLISLLGYIFLYLAMKRFKNQLHNIAPIVREAPPPPTIEAPIGPAPRPSLGVPKAEFSDDVPTPDDN